MSELRRRALGNGKTTSRKAQSRQSSAASSKASSRNASRSASRVNTDDEGDLSDDTTFSFGSLADVLGIMTLEEERDESSSSWVPDAVNDVVLQILDRKGSSAASRESAFADYVRLLCSRFVGDNIEDRKDEVIECFLRSIKAPRTQKEALLATNALGLTMVTSPDDTIYDKISQIFKKTITDCESLALKTALIHVLGAASFYGGATWAETEGIMEFFMEIVESDGHNVGAGDDGGVVTAALEEWGFMATQLDDVKDLTSDVINTFIEQLDSTEVPVQVAAGENIALLYEKSMVEEEGQFETYWVQRYKPHPRPEDLKDTLSALAGGSKKFLSKKNKKTQKSAFSDILRTVGDPLCGPGYSDSRDEDGNVRGERLTVRLNRTGVLYVDKWYKLHRVQHLRRMLGGGLLIHWSQNPVIFESLDLFVESAPDYKKNRK